jgi:hypothetical protein
MWTVTDALEPSAQTTSADASCGPFRMGFNIS